MQLKVGEIVEGTVKSLTKFGAFVALDANTTGLVHISEVAHAYVSDLHEYLTEGQTVKVMFKDGKTNNVLGVYAVSDNTVYNTLMKNVELDGQKLKFEGSSYSVDSTKSIDLTFVGIDGVD